MLTKELISLKAIYEKAVLDKEDALKELKHENKKVALIIILFLSTAVWMLSIVLFGYEAIKGNYDIYSTVHDCAICNDGWVSHSWGPGTCSWHGGVKYYKYKQEQIGVHHSKPEKYYPFIVVSLIIIVIPSIPSTMYRKTAISFQLTGLWCFGMFFKLIYGGIFLTVVFIYHSVKDGIKSQKKHNS